MKRTHTGSPLGLLTLAALCLAPACASPTGLTNPDTQLVDEYRVGSIVFTASSRRVVGSAVEVTLTATNESTAPAQASIRGGDCILRPRVYSSRGGRILWSHFDGAIDCQDSLRAFDLAGGASESVSQTFNVYLENGDNFFTITIMHDGRLVEIAAGTINVD